LKLKTLEIFTVWNREKIKNLYETETIIPTTSRKYQKYSICKFLFSFIHFLRSQIEGRKTMKLIQRKFSPGNEEDPILNLG
jgi:hypothetical protein